MASLTTGIINSEAGIYKSPVTGDSLSIDEAVTKGLISATLLSTKTRREIIQPEVQTATFTERRSYTITHAKDTITGESYATPPVQSCNPSKECAVTSS